MPVSPERFPTDIADLVTVPGVGRKTATSCEVWRSDSPGLPVDTHVLRVSKRLGLTEFEDPIKVEHALNALIAPADRGAFSLRMILHGRATCRARTPGCGRCVLADICPSAPTA